MSQKKVDEYKEKKAKRKELAKKEKRMSTVRRGIGVLVLFVIIGWVSYSAYDLYLSKQPRETVEIDYNAIDEYLQEAKETTEG